ncbi:MAG: uridine diphosphate-N-acetylglucosamine-binding protein YvcK [Mobiluncus porci]|uniref:Putative gluconeogenesis factor n=1 Tax=Mobiluncus porci TaxID=2652278 RepID=A0A7K0K6F5_9ACTO|nr:MULTISPECIES: uridine diphosphate-N-acetylglucosamine-binding protein YvcK [Mobiluncus]MCI6584917.1 uridine diphosphate-N-acetylglucosamine-binding protein YvcK [Mobiluncus sp.]MDD7542239.1 uridine diphosphate-N-acetylglucosamine-binding protein YvcK [Mobiluncus porci]MDY5749038.1 uridine diphosphate-N-acetylglucosamine-binding protein YvcK [Mobiluncus porci]MST50620.1 uridine diphosphate-N-acetylglucosamine-binding protein YvcK [Mobiluncus porci]
MSKQYGNLSHWPNRHQQPKVVAFGGGHGLYATLQALRHVTRNLTAVVTVADDGGSSGRLREEFDLIPPGDLRMALAALCDESNWGLTWRDILQFRFKSDGELNGHSLGNLLMAGLWEILGDPVSGLDWLTQLLDAKGRVLPLSRVPMEITAEMEVGGTLRTVKGQSKIAKAPGMIRSIRLDPPDAPVPPEVLEAVAEADWIVLGPGSWFTSVMPHLLLAPLREALSQASARKALVLNLSRQRGETQDLPLPDHLRVLGQYAPELGLNIVIGDPAAVVDIDDLEHAAQTLGCEVMLRQLSVGDGTARHDPLRLAAAFRDAMSGNWGDLAPIEDLDNH